MSDSPLALHMKGITKAFGSTQALAGVDLEVRVGEVHALIGENGAGKSTLMKTLSGAIKADAGTMDIMGAPYQPSGPLEARERGIAMIYQELNLAPDLSVEDNMMLGREGSRFGLRQRAKERVRVQEALALLDQPEISPATKVNRLSPGASQLVEIARALAADAKILVMDEPTSSLSSEDSQRLFRVVRDLKKRGVSIIYISHFLDEISEICDRYTVLRDGQTVGSGQVAESDHERWITLMVGRKLEEIYPKVSHQIGAPLLSIDQFKAEKLPSAVQFEVRRGEIMGLFGLVGAGRTEFLRAIFALDAVESGEIKVGSVSAPHPSPRNRLQQGIGLLSEDRKEEGLALGMSLAENLTLSHHRPFSKAGFLNLRQQRDQTSRWIDKLQVRCQSPTQKIGDLSGGNQQKIALGRLLHHGVDVLLLDEPTRGVDVGSKVEIYRVIGELAQSGCAVLMVSSYLPELFGVCDRIAVMARGQLQIPKPVSELSKNEVLAEATA